MPRLYRMTPEFKGRHSRWRKMHKGELHFVSCADLGLPETLWNPVGSYKAANAWWETKQKELDMAPLDRERAQIVRRLTVIEQEQDELYRQRKGSGAGRKLGAALDKWVGILRPNLEASSLVQIAVYVKFFKSACVVERVPVLSADTLLADIDEDKVADVFTALDTLLKSGGTKKKYWDTFRSFVTYASENRWMPLPRNLRSKRLVFSGEVRSKELPDVKGVTAFVDGLPDRLKLYALLAWNTGMNNTDIAHLRERQIDLAAGTLRRKRIKTEKWDNVPSVLYSLWPETARLLAQEMTPGAEFALLDGNGKSLFVTNKDKGGKPSFYDKIKSKWRDALGDTPYTMRDFRDFGSLLLQNSKYRVYRVAWLGHTPKEVHEKHYSGEEDVIEACRWLLERITELSK